MSRKLVTVEFLAEERRELAAIGKRIAFTNGCFDLFHTGHLASLRFARSQADALAVAVNSDASIRAIKGPSRPIIPLEQRVEILCALECVDYVVTFDTETPRDLIAAVLPDVLVKGDEYKFAPVAGAVEVITAGGRVEFHRRESGTPSTSEIIHRVRSISEASVFSVAKSESPCAV